MSTHKVYIVDGCGRMGFPLALSLASRNIQVIIHDQNPEIVKKIMQGKVPFYEKSAQLLLNSVLNKTLIATSSLVQIEDCEHVILCQEPATEENLLRFFHEAESYLSIGQTMIFRSTLLPGMSESLHKALSPKGYRICYCPDRISEGNAIHELVQVPQIISAFTEEAFRVCEELFSYVSKEIIRLTPLEAELTALFNNTWGYMKYAIANQFFRISKESGASFNKIATAMRHHYPRGMDFPSAGFISGPRLGEDTQSLNEYSSSSLFQSGIEINRGMPRYIIDQIKKEYHLPGMTVGILGMTYKKEVDDIRNSLSFNLKKLLLEEGAKVLCSDEYWKDPSLVNKHQLVNESELILIGCPHEAYETLDLKKKPVVDLWEIHESIFS